MATLLERLTDTLGLLPNRGTYPIAANTKILKGTLVGLNSSGQAIVATTAATCKRVVGKASSTYDNLTGSALGGAAGAVDVEVEFGVFNWGNSAAADEISADDIGKLCYAVDNETVALTSNGGTRQIAGLIAEFKPRVYGGTSVPWIWCHPLVPVFYDTLTDLASTANAKGAALVGIEDAGTFTTTATVEAALQEIYQHLLSAKGVFIPLSLYDFREVSAGGDVGNVAAIGGVLASDTTPIMRGDAAETAEIFWAAGNADPISTQIVLPPDFVGTANVTVELWVYSGAADAASFTVETGWDGGALVSDTADDAGTKSASLHKITATVAATDIPDAARLLTLALTPPAHATNGIGLLGVAINGKRALLAA